MAGDFIRDSGVQKWINVFGDVQLIDGLTRLQNKLQRKVVKDAIRRGLVPIRAKARRNAPRGDRGLLKKAIKSQVTRMLSGKVFVDPSVVAVDGKVVKFRTKNLTKKEATRQRFEYLNKERAAGKRIIQPAKYAHLVEFGTRYGAKGQVTTNKSGPKKIRRRAHAATAAHPFMRPALEASRNEVLNIMRQEIQKALDELEKSGK